MGIYAVTGGSKGIGAKVVELLRGGGNDVMNIDIAGGDINADLGEREGRHKVIETVHEMCPEGLDGLVANAGVAFTGKYSTVLSVNYFGTVAVAEGLYDLLKLKKGRCVVTVSGSLCYTTRNKLYVDSLLTNCGDEDRIGRLVDTFDPSVVDNAVYGSTKIALVRWIRRTAPSWAVRGVSLNAVAPGGVATTIMKGVTNMGIDMDRLWGLPMPGIYAEKRLMDPLDIASTIVLLVQPGARGISGDVVYCDMGTSALLHPEKFY
jgi:NAD(P)-dependent dehydrogenase (short-subunit alcohol dehydrogenase family)